MIKSPQVIQPTQQQTKDPPVLRNPYLDGINPIIRAQAGGTSSLRIDRTPPSVSPLTVLRTPG